MKERHSEKKAKRQPCQRVSAMQKYLGDEKLLSVTLNIFIGNVNE